MLKVGDRVRIVKFPDSDVVGMVATVINVYYDGDLYPYRVEDSLNNTWGCLVRTDEIEKMPVKGQQLLFEFMV